MKQKKKINQYHTVPWSAQLLMRCCNLPKRLFFNCFVYFGDPFSAEGAIHLMEDTSQNKCFPFALPVGVLTASTRDMNSFFMIPFHFVRLDGFPRRPCRPVAAGSLLAAFIFDHFARAVLPTPAFNQFY